MSGFNQNRSFLHNVVNDSFFENMKDVNTCVPGHVLTFNAVTQRAQVQIGISRVDEITSVSSNPPVIIDVPVSFPGDSYTVEFEIETGCEGMIHFSQRCIDAWKRTGGIAANPARRFHNRQDAMFVPGIRSLNNVISNFSNDGLRLRNSDASQYVWLKKDGSVIIKNADSSITFDADNNVTTTNGNGTIEMLANGNVQINGVVIDPTGNITVPSGGGIKGSNGVDYETHRHNETGSITGTPVS